MKARIFNKRIEIWSTSSISDGFGGTIASSPTLLGKSWANIKTMGVNSKYANTSTSNGLEPYTDAIIIQVRKRNDLTYSKINQFIKYKGVNYVIKNIPINVNFRDDVIELVAQRQEVKNVS